MRQVILTSNRNFDRGSKEFFPARDDHELIGSLIQAASICGDNYSIYELHSKQEADDLEVTCQQFPAYLLPNGDVLYTADEVYQYLSSNHTGDYTIEIVD